MEFLKSLNRKLNCANRKAHHALNFLIFLVILGINWSFRFASQRKKKMVLANEIPHLDIRDWLHRMELMEYEDSFKKYSEVKEIINLSESDIKELGVKNSAHRARMVASLVALKGKNFLLNNTKF